MRESFDPPVELEEMSFSWSRGYLDKNFREICPIVFFFKSSNWPAERLTYNMAACTAAPLT